MVKSELFRAGIRTEIRSNPLTEALRVPRLELWVEDERDMFNASKLYTELQTRGSGNGSRTKAAAEEDSKNFFELADPGDEAQGGRRRRTSGNGVVGGNGPGDRDLEQVSSLLEKEIDDLLARESELAGKCASLRTKVKELTAALTNAEAGITREKEGRAALERKTAAEISSLQGAVARERAGHAQVREQLEREQREFRQQLKSRDEALKEAQQKLETRMQQLQTQQAAVVELRKEIVSRELQFNEQEKALSKARAEATAERETRLVAEERADRAISAQKSLEKELAARKDMQEQMQAAASSLDSLRHKLQAKRTAAPDLG